MTDARKVKAKKVISKSCTHYFSSYKAASAIVAGDTDYDELLRRVGDVLQKGRDSIAAAVNSAIVQLYWEIGQYIVEYEQKGHAKAEDGSDVVNRLSGDLMDHYSKGVSRSPTSFY